MKRGMRNYNNHKKQYTNIHKNYNTKSQYGNIYE